MREYSRTNISRYRQNRYDNAMLEPILEIPANSSFRGWQFNRCFRCRWSKDRSPCARGWVHQISRIQTKVGTKAQKPEVPFWSSTFDPTGNIWAEETRKHVQRISTLWYDTVLDPMKFFIHAFFCHFLSIFGKIFESTLSILRTICN